MPLNYAGKTLRGRPFKPGEDLREANFSGANLRGVNFKGLDLSGANFSHADIRGANFTKAILKGANFSHAKAGLQKFWMIYIVILSLLVGVVTGVASGQAGVLASSAFSPDFIREHTLIPSVIIFTILIFFFISTIQYGVTTALFALAWLLGLAWILVWTIATDKAGAWTLALALAIGWSWTWAWVGGLASAWAETYWVLVWLSVGALTWTVSGALSRALTHALKWTDIRSWFLGGTGAWVIALLGAYIGRRALAGDSKFTFVRSVINALAAYGGTSFREADLTDSDFTKATLKSTDFRGIILTRTDWYQAKKLDRARPGDSILAKVAVRDLLVSGNGYKKSYIGANLKGANLSGANLNWANLKEADLSEATLHAANLEWANLTKIQAIGTDFTNAQMTGACIEAWNIDSSTKLDKVDCRFIYLLEQPKPGTDDRERRPSSGDFAPGEFTKLFEEVLNTVDLIFRNGVDWKAFVAAFKKVQVEHEGTELAIQSIANKGDGVVVVRASVSPDADKEKIHSDFNQNYQLALAEVEKRYKAELQAKDREIQIYRQQGSDMKEIVSLLANRPVNVINTATSESKAMSDSTDQSRSQKLEIGSVGRDFNASGQALNVGNIDISGVVTNTINELPASPEADKPGLKELLTQLQAAIEAETHLSDEDKAEALEQVKALAEAGKNPKEGTMQKAAKTASTMLKGIFAGLPAAATLVEAWNKLWPAIASLFSLA